MISVIAVTLRVPSDRRVTWMIRFERRRDLLPDRAVRDVQVGHRDHRVETIERVARLLAWTVVRLPSWPVFIACSMSSASSPRTSPTMMRSGRIRSALITRSRWRTAPLPSMFGGRVSSRTTWRCRSMSSAASSIVTIRSSFGDEAGQHVEQRRLAGARAARDDDIQPAGDRRAQEIEHRLGQRIAVDEILGAQPVGSEPPDRQRRAVERQRRNDRVDARAVGSRASTIGLDSSMRRPTELTMRSMICMR